MPCRHATPVGRRLKLFAAWGRCRSCGSGAGSGASPAGPDPGNACSPTGRRRSHNLSGYVAGGPVPVGAHAGSRVGLPGFEPGTS